MPYVVRLHNCGVLDKPQPVFTFVHPNKGTLLKEFIKGVERMKLS